MAADFHMKMGDEDAALSSMEKARECFRNVLKINPDLKEAEEELKKINKAG